MAANLGDGIPASAVQAATSFDYAPAEDVFAKIDRNQDGFITRSDFEKAVAAGAMVLEEEPPADMFLDKLGRSVYQSSAPAQAPPQAAAGQASSMQPQNSPWAGGTGADGRRTRGVTFQPGHTVVDDRKRRPEYDEEVGEMTWHRMMWQGLLWRMGFEKELNVVFNFKNNELTRMLAHLRNIWVFIGIFVLALIVMVPTWNALRLLQDPAYSYFVGKTIPRGMLSVCVALPIFYVCTISLLFKRGTMRVLNEQSLLGVGTLFLLALGFALAMFSFPLGNSAHEAYETLITTCQSGIKSRELYQTSQALQMLRQSQNCSVEHSVIACKGFQMTAFAKVLQDMEETYLCSGFCYSEAPILAATQPAQAAATTPPPSLLQVSAIAEHGRQQGPAGVTDTWKGEQLVVKSQMPEVMDAFEQAQRALAAAQAIKHVTRGSKLYSLKGELSADATEASAVGASSGAYPGETIMQAGWAGGYPQGVTDWGTGRPSRSMIPPQVAQDPAIMAFLNSTLNTTVISPYAPTLFSTLNWKASCHGMAANAMKHGVGNVAQASFLQGFVLMFFSIAIGFMQLLGMCYMPKYRF